MKNEELTTETHPLVTPEHLQRLAVVYIRQSSEEQVARNTGSTAFQRNLAAVARSYGWPDSRIRTIDEDLGKSGLSTEPRSGWQRLQTMVARNEVGAVFAVAISRLSRQVLDFELFRILAAAHNTLIYFDGRFIDPADSNDTMLSQVTAMIAHYENRKRAEIMSAARYTKARQGIAVSALPVGWIKNADGKYEFDSRVEDSIRMVIQTFWETRAIRRTVKKLVEAGIQIPARQGKAICFKKPTIDNVRKILTHPAYCGTYVYGTTRAHPGETVLSDDESTVLSNREPKRRKISEDRWIKIPNHHPGYMTPEEQEEIKSIFKKNHFQSRYRAGRGAALSQGLLRCAVCHQTLSVSYQRSKSYCYTCSSAIRFAGTPCTRFVSCDFDKYIVREVFKVLKAPSVEMLKSALEASRKNQENRLFWIESERERLRREERRARERIDATDSLPRVHRDALVKLEQVLKEKEEFQRTAASELAAPRHVESEAELQELCRLASEVPSLWNHPTVTNQERKEILRAVIDHVVIAATKERIDATIHWKTGEKTPFSIWRGIGRYNLIRELYEQKLTVPEIKERLAAGKTSNGQVVDLSEDSIYLVLHRLGLTPNRFSAQYIELGKKAGELHLRGWSHRRIAEFFNKQGFPSASGRAWTWTMVRVLHHAVGGKTELLEEIHRSVIVDARARGLTYEQMADEFNRKNIGRWSRQPWSKRNVEKRCCDLERLDRRRAGKALTGTEASPQRKPKSA